MKLFMLLLTCTCCLANSLLIYPNYNNHECKRKCDGSKKVCRYKFNIEYMFTLEPNCLKCLEGNVEDCKNPACVIGDGRKRMFIAFNRMLPGPAIEVCVNDEIIVELKNNLVDSETTLHFHGIRQKHTQWMDGVPWITQCPINAGTKFIYHFKADVPGTYFYHSHSGTQEGDGAYGALIIRQPKESNPHEKLYEQDLSEHVLVLTDWYYNISKYHYIDDQNNRYFNWHMISAVLTNGVGATDNNGVPPNIFIVEQGIRYRFRVISTAAEPCPLSLTIEGHKITVISTDGHDIKPITVDTLHLLNGERYDFILEANQTPNNYAIKLFGGIVCDNHTSYSILQYKETTSTSIDFNSAEFADNNGLGANCINMYNNKMCYNYDNMTTIDHIELRMKSIPTKKFFIGYDLYNYTFPNLRGVTTIGLRIPFINNISFIQPSSPLLLNPRDKDTKICNVDHMQDATCNGQFCQCTHVINVEKGSLVEMIFVDEGSRNLTHPMHLHGHSFRVIGQQKLGQNTTIDLVKKLDKLGSLMRNFNDPPIKDTVSVPYGGYTIVRFIADNPGYWALHCHVNFHMVDGMFMVVKVGLTPSVPRKFPNCGSYLHTNEL